jgi:hypothetical protein
MIPAATGVLVALMLAWGFDPVLAFVAYAAIWIACRRQFRETRLRLSWLLVRAWRWHRRSEAAAAGVLAMATDGDFHFIEHMASWRGAGYFARPFRHRDDAALERALVGYRTASWLGRDDALGFVLAVVRHKAQRGRLSDLTSSPSSIVRLLVAPVALDLHAAGNVSPLADLGLSNFAAGQVVYRLPNAALAVDTFERHRQYFEALLGGTVTIGPADVPGAVQVARLPDMPAVLPLADVAAWRAALGADHIALGVDLLTAEPVFVPVSEFHHLLIAGTSGFGKSVFLHQVVSQVLDVGDALERIILVDLKGGAEFRRYQAGNRVEIVWRFADVVRVVVELLELMDRRLAEMVAKGRRSWPGGRVFFVVDEFAQIALHPWVTKEEKAVQDRLMANLSRLSMLGRAAGIVIVCAIQKPTQDGMASSFRANLQGQVCFRVASRLTAASMFGETGDLLLDPIALLPGQFIFADPMTGTTRYLQAFVADQALEADHAAA